MPLCYLPYLLGRLLAIYNILTILDKFTAMKSKLLGIWTEYKSLFTFLVIMVLFRSAIADWNQVPTGSMKPTILEGDRVVVNKLAYDLKIPFTSWQIQRWSDPVRGEIVTFYSPNDEKLLIKRVIGTPGDVIAMRNNQLFINETPASYGELDNEIILQLDLYQQHSHAFFVEEIDKKKHAVMMRPAEPNHYNSFGPVEVPKGQYLMLGDNRDNSHDSRAIGLITRNRITGRAHTVAFSVDYKDYFLPRIDRFIRPLDYR